MFGENELLNEFLNLGRKIIPRGVFRWAQPIYHWKLAMLGALIYGFPSRAMTVIAVTGTKGKSTTVFMISKIFEEQGLPVAAVGSLGFKIKERTWPNNLKMTLPGRMKLQKFLWHARQNFLTGVSSAGDKKPKNLGGQAKKDTLGYVILEATSEGITQNRLAGVKIDCAVYTNLHREHLESHGSFENYMVAKQKLFLKTRGIHVLNIDDPYFEKFANFSAGRKVTYGQQWGDVMLENPNDKIQNSNQVQNPKFKKIDGGSLKIENLNLKLLGNFNVCNALAALAVAHAYNLDIDKAIASLNSIESVPGRMEIVHAPAGFDVVIDYAHTPDSLELVYKTLKNQLHAPVEVKPQQTPQQTEVQPLGALEVEPLNTSNQQPRPCKQERGKPATSNQHQAGRLICLLGAAGGGRDKWKRPEFGRIAAQYCDEVILTNEDPYDENPNEILDQIASGFSSSAPSPQPPAPSYRKILDRKEAIKTALSLAESGDLVVITGKGSETSMAMAGGKKIPWLDKEVVEKFLRRD